MNTDTFKKSWGYSPVKESEKPTTPEAAEPPQQEPRFNARKHNYRGEHVVTNEEEKSTYDEMFEGFAAAHGLETFTHRVLVAEAAKSLFQANKIEKDLQPAIKEKGYGHKDVQLMHRYLKEHRANLRRALQSLAELRRVAVQEANHITYLKYKGPATKMDVESRALKIAIQATQTEFYRANPQIRQNIYDMLGWKLNTAPAATPPQE
jgi:DNA-directed RNA polymerase subunit H (RpoH/RPB5)